ncbi:MAG: hypothetical protein Q7N95_04485, partial [Alphaproteobacteria bacterium]|nr:hypothetical protein [Alphaproteobacteria bacterium]
TDGDGDTATDTASVSLAGMFVIQDDGIAVGGFDRAIIVAQDNQVANGTYDASVGVDGFAAILAAVHNGAAGGGYNLATTNLGNGITSVHVTGNGADYTFYYTTQAVNGGVELEAYFTNTSGSLTNPFFTLTINPDETYSFNLISVGFLEQTTVSGSDFGASGGGQPSLTSPDGELTITGDLNGVPANVKASNNGIAVGNTGLQMDVNETLILNFAQEQTEVSFIFTQWQGNGTANVEFHVLDENGLTISDFDINIPKPAGDSHIEVIVDTNLAGSYVFNAGTSTYTLYVGEEFSEVQVEYDFAVTGGATFTVNNITFDKETSIPSTSLLFDITAVDGDGDTSTTSLHVDLLGGSNVVSGLTLTGTSDEDVLVGGTGNDTLIGGAGDDTLTGGTGNDLFVLQASNGGHDDILDFVSGADDIVVDIASLNLTIGTSVVLDAANFHTGDENVAATWNGGTGNEFAFNAGTGELWYSANGMGTDLVNLASIATGIPVATDIHTF